jgi:predicted ATPase
MIKEISLKGFKSFLYTDLTLNKLTVLTGLNSSGKSSIIQALRMMEKAVNDDKNIILDGHGSVEELRNTYYREPFSIGLSDDQDNLFSVLFSNPLEIKNNKIEFPEIIYVSANRFGPKTSIPIYSDTSKKNKIGENGENVLQCIEQLGNEKLDERLKHEHSEGFTLLYNIRGWLSVIAPNVEFEYEIQKMSDSSYSKFNAHRATNVGFGLSYTLPVITALLVGTIIPNSLVTIENPEAHLHPKGQTEIAKLIALCSQVGAQIIIETHSDHIFDGIRIAAKELNIADDIQIHWFELNDKKNTEVFSPTLTNDGRINEWHKGFFDQFEINSSKLI